MDENGYEGDKIIAERKEKDGVGEEEEEEDNNKKRIICLPIRYT